MLLGIAENGVECADWHHLQLRHHPIASLEQPSSSLSDPIACTVAVLTPMPMAPASRAIILHPLVAPVGGDLSPEARAVAEWLRAQSFLSPPLVENPAALRPLSLLDFTCDENVHAVLSFLDGPSLCAARSVCRSWRRLSNDDELWLHLCLHEFHVSPAQLATPPESYQQLYQFACRSLKTLLRDYLHEQCLSNLQNSLRIPRAAAMTLIASRSSV